MVKFTDILLQLIIGLIYLIGSLLIFTLTRHTILILPFFIFITIINYSIKRNKKIAKYLTSEFQQLGYEILDERPLKLSEANVTVKFAVLVNDIPLNRYGYIRRFARVFTAKYSSGQIFELNTIVTKKWNGTNHISIKKETKTNSI